MTVATQEMVRRESGSWGRYFWYLAVELLGLVGHKMTRAGQGRVAGSWVNYKSLAPKSLMEHTLTITTRKMLGTGVGRVMGHRLGQEEACPQADLTALLI